jgi:hypothetical protein
MDFFGWAKQSLKPGAHSHPYINPLNQPAIHQRGQPTFFNLNYLTPVQNQVMLMLIFKIILVT